MKNFIRCVILFVCLSINSAANAITYNVVVLPADILRVCENYYCYPEVSEIVANDLIKYFNASNKIKSPTLPEILPRAEAVSVCPLCERSLRITVAVSGLPVKRESEQRCTLF